MASEPGFPLVMVHPHHKPAELRQSASDPNSPDYGLPGSPERFPPIEVHSAGQEAEVRARGYLRYGEEMPRAAQFNEYPKMVHHPNHIDAVAASQGARLEDGKLVTFAIPGTAEKFPAVSVRDAADEKAWAAKGYHAAARSDPVAFDRAIAAPGKPGEEWPKWVDGVLTQDPEAPADLSREYPKWVHFASGDSVLVNDPAHEARVLAGQPSETTRPERPSPKPYLPLPAPVVEDAEYQEFLAWKAQKDAARPQNATHVEHATPVTSMRNFAQAIGKSVSHSTPAEREAEKAELLARAKKAGVTIDQHWSLDRLREVVNDHAD